MKVLLVCGQHQYGDVTRGESTEYHAFMPALRSLGHDAIHFESWQRGRFMDFADLNRMLLEVTKRHRPRVLLSVQRDVEIWTETLDALRTDQELATISWATDDSWKFRQVSKFIGRHYHAMATTYAYRLADYARNGISNVIATQWAANSIYLRRPVRSVDCRWDVTFVGAANAVRRRYLAEIRRLGLEVACFGHGWPAGSRQADELPEIMRSSRVSLNFSTGTQGGPKQVKARMFEVPGAGGLLLTERAPGQDQYYSEDREILAFSSPRELVDKARRCIADPRFRDAVAQAGFERTKAEHTYERRLKEVLDFAVGAQERSAREPVRTPGFEQACRRHTGGWVIPAASALGAIAGSYWSGARSVRRYARRLIFELSWRFVGERTFSASGWPGRLFPDR